MKGSTRRREAEHGSYESNWDKVFKQEKPMAKDPNDNDTQDIDDFLEDLYEGIPPDLDFGEHDDIDSDSESMVCPCCHENEISCEQAEEQLEGETCTVCNFHTWEDNS